MDPRFDPIFTQKFFNAQIAQVNSNFSFDLSLLPDDKNNLQAFLNSEKGQGFITTVTTLLIDLRSWCDKYGITYNPESFLIFADKFRADINQQAGNYDLYTNGIPKLAEIVSYLASQPVTQNTKNIVMGLLEVLEKCSAEVSSNLTDALVKLKNDATENLMLIRREIAREIIAKICIPKLRYNSLYHAGNDVHYVNVILNFLADKIVVAPVVDAFTQEPGIYSVVHAMMPSADFMSIEAAIIKGITVEIVIEHILSTMDLKPIYDAIDVINKSEEPTEENFNQLYANLLLLDKSLGLYGSDDAGWTSSSMLENDEEGKYVLRDPESLLRISLFKRLLNSGYIQANSYEARDNLFFVKNHGLGFAYFMAEEKRRPLIEYMSNNTQQDLGIDIHWLTDNSAKIVYLAFVDSILSLLKDASNQSKKKAYLTSLLHTALNVNSDEELFLVDVLNELDEQKKQVLLQGAIVKYIATSSKFLLHHIIRTIEPSFREAWLFKVLTQDLLRNKLLSNTTTPEQRWLLVAQLPSSTILSILELFSETEICVNICDRNIDKFLLLLPLLKDPEKALFTSKFKTLHIRFCEVNYKNILYFANSADFYSFIMKIDKAAFHAFLSDTKVLLQACFGMQQSQFKLLLTDIEAHEGADSFKKGLVTSWRQFLNLVGRENSEGKLRVFEFVGKANMQEFFRKIGIIDLLNIFNLMSDDIRERCIGEYEILKIICEDYIYELGPINLSLLLDLLQNSEGLAKYKEPLEVIVIHLLAQGDSVDEIANCKPLDMDADEFLRLFDFNLLIENVNTIADVIRILASRNQQSLTDESSMPRFVQLVIYNLKEIELALSLLPRAHHQKFIEDFFNNIQTDENTMQTLREIETLLANSTLYTMLVKKLGGNAFLASLQHSVSSANELIDVLSPHEKSLLIETLKSSKSIRCVSLKALFQLLEKVDLAHRMDIIFNVNIKPDSNGTLAEVIDILKLFPDENRVNVFWIFDITYLFSADTPLEEINKIAELLPLDAQTDFIEKCKTYCKRLNTHDVHNNNNNNNNNNYKPVLFSSKRKQMDSQAEAETDDEEDHDLVFSSDSDSNSNGSDYDSDSDAGSEKESRKRQHAAEEKNNKRPHLPGSDGKSGP